MTDRFVTRNKVRSFNGIRFLAVVFASLFLVSFGMLAHDVFADQVVATIPVGDYPQHIAVNPNTNRIYVGSYGSMEVIDGTTDSLMAKIDGVGFTPAVNPITNKIYVASGPNTISVIDGITNNVTATIDAPGSFIAVNPNTNKIYVAASYSLKVVDGVSNNVIGTVSLRTSQPSDVAVNPATNMIYATGWCVCTTPSDPSGKTHPLGLLYIIDGSTDKLVDTLELGSYGGDIGINSITNMIYVSNGYIYVINGATNTVVNQIGGFHAGDGLGVNPATNKIYVADTSSNLVGVVDGATNNVLSTVPVGSSPQGHVGVNPSTNKIYVANFDSKTISVLDGSSSSSTSIPSAPQNLSAIAGNGQILLSWSTPPSDGGSPITGYNVYRSTSSGTETFLAYTGNNLSYTDNGVTNGQTYFYTITAVNSVGESAQSNEASATPVAPATAPDAPTGLTATAISSSQIDLSWTASSNDGGSPVTGYQIERSTDSGSTWSTVVQNTGSTEIIYTDTGLTSSTTFAYRVSAINSVGTSDMSNMASATTFNASPLQPTTVTMTIQSADMSGNAFDGMWVELWQNGALIQEGATPLSASVTTGAQYEIFMDNWQQTTFDHWEDGSTNQRRTFTPTQDATLTAFFSTGSTTNNPPMANNDSAQTTVDNPVKISVLANDSDPDGDTLSITSASTPSNGMATINADMTVTYTPNSSFVGTDSFTYAISDGRGGTDTALVSVTVKSTAPPPTTTNAVLTIRSADMSGNEITGMWAEIWNGSTLVKEGYTPLSYSALTQKQYSLWVSDWEQTVFDHWEDGSTIRDRAISITQATTVTALYRTSTSSSGPIIGLP